MKSLLMALTAALALAACSSPQSRIKKHQSEFDAYPADVQQKIRDGRVDVGFTPEQVQLALGAPSRVYTRKTASGTQEVWAYSSGGGPSVGLGFGVFSGGPSVYNVGVGVGSSGDYPDDRQRVIFENGRVATLEQREK